jgi:glycogen(starch) synthase
VRLLIISNLLPPRALGGYEIACWNIAKGLRERGHDVLVLTSPTDRIPLDDQSIVERTLTMTAYAEPPVREPHVKALIDHQDTVSQPDNTLVVLDALRRFRPDRVIAFNLIGLGAMAILDLLTTAGVPWIVNLGDRIPIAITEAVEPEIRQVYGFDGANGFSAGSFALVSQGLADEIAAGGIELGERVTVISRGVRPSGLRHTRAYRDGGVTRFVAAGAVEEHKGVGLIIEAATALVAAGQAGFTVDVYGRGDVERYTRAAADAGMGDIVRFRGSVPQDDLFWVYAESDAFLFPTWAREPFGSAPLEAAAVGCVPILTANSGAAERLVDGVHCLKIERSAEALTAAMLRVLRGEVDLSAMGSAGAQLIAGPLSFERSLDELEAFIEPLGKPGWERGGLDDEAIGRDVAERSERARELLLASLERTDARQAERASVSGTARASVRAVGRLVGSGGRRLLARSGAGAGVEKAPADADLAARTAALELENEVLRKENLALRHQVGWLSDTAE